MSRSVTSPAGALLLACAALCHAQTPPYPPSPVITGVAFDYGSVRTLAPGSDNWIITWADDDRQYTSWGDGGGFGGTNSSGRVSLGFARVTGPWDGYSGQNVWGGYNTENPAQFDGKSYGLVCIGGILYAWVQPGSDNTNYSETRMCRSVDHAATWTRAGWAFTQSQGIVIPTICNFGRDYAGARDDYVYHYFINLKNSGSLAVQKPGEIVLARSPKTQLMTQSAYEFFAGLDGGGNPAWTANVSARQPVFRDPEGVGWCISVSYNPGLKRYLLCSEHTAGFAGNLGIFDAPEPWGPWTTVYYRKWGGTSFFWNFSNKWLGADGRDFTIVSTGYADTDSWNTIRGRFTANPVKGEGPGGRLQDAARLAAFPNPFTKSTEIRFAGTPSGGAFSLGIYDPQGACVRDFSGIPGSYRPVRWDGTDRKGAAVASGVYILRGEAERVTVFQRLLLSR